MSSEITIKIMIGSEGSAVSAPAKVEISGLPTPSETATLPSGETVGDQGELPRPASLEELTAMAGMATGRRPVPAATVELKVTPGVEAGEAPMPMSLEELEAMAGPPSTEEAPKPEEGKGKRGRKK